MDKKDIYEHLANIYLDASSKTKKKRAKTYHRFVKTPFIIALTAILFVSSALFFVFRKNRPLTSEIVLVFSSDAARINFNFDPARKEAYSINLNKLNLSRFKTLAFSVKKGNYKDKVSLRVEFTNSFKEISEVYIKDIPHKWRDYKIPLSDFKKIGTWSEMTNLSFIIEEWNATSKKDNVYIDNVRLIR